MGDEESKSFLAIKEAFLNVMIINHPDFEKPFHIQCDSSAVAVGGSLFQYLEGEIKGVMAYTNSTLKGSQLLYTTTEKSIRSSLLLAAVAYSYFRKRNNNKYRL